MDKGAIEAIQNGAAPVFKEAEGLEFSNKEFFPIVIDGSVKKPILVDFLESVVTFCKGKEDLSINVSGPDHVNVIDSGVDEFGRRSGWLSALPSLPDYNFKHYMDISEAIIMLRTLFANSDQVNLLIATIGKITNSKIVTSEDDGISQSVQFQKGVTMSESKKVPLIVNLTPFQTFFEIEQVERPFMIRLREGRNEMPEIAFFPADGGAWKAEACRRIRTYLQENLPDIQIL